MLEHLVPQVQQLIAQRRDVCREMVSLRLQISGLGFKTVHPFPLPLPTFGRRYAVPLEELFPLRIFFWILLSFIHVLRFSTSLSLLWAGFVWLGLDLLPVIGTWCFQWKGILSHLIIHSGKRWIVTIRRDRLELWCLIGRCDLSVLVAHSGQPVSLRLG